MCMLTRTCAFFSLALLMCRQWLDTAIFITQHVKILYPCSDSFIISVITSFVEDLLQYCQWAWHCAMMINVVTFSMPFSWVLCTWTSLSWYKPSSWLPEISLTSRTLYASLLTAVLSSHSWIGFALCAGVPPMDTCILTRIHYLFSLCHVLDIHWGREADPCHLSINMLCITWCMSLASDDFSVNHTCSGVCWSQESPSTPIWSTLLQ